LISLINHVIRIGIDPALSAKELAGIGFPKLDGKGLILPQF